MRTDWIPPDNFRLLLTALMPENRLALEVAEATGLRIGDVLALRTSDVEKERPTIREAKTGKAKRLYIPKRLREDMLCMAGRKYVFEGRTDWRRHRTRQAVWKDLKRVAKLYRIEGTKIRANVAPHTARKIYAVSEFRQNGGNLADVQRKLNHTDPAVTALYVMAAELSGRKKRRG